MLAGWLKVDPATTFPITRNRFYDRTVKRIKPLPGQESVWDYPRPPSIVGDSRRIIVEYNREVVADSIKAVKVLETSHPPVFYIPGSDIDLAYLYPTTSTSWCEFKGRAAYWTVAVGEREAIDSVWGYPTPVETHAELAGRFAFYPSKMDRCTVDGIVVESQQGDFYGGWVTPEVVGPFKGAPGTRGW